MAKCALCGNDALTHEPDGSCRVIREDDAAKRRPFPWWARLLIGAGACALVGGGLHRFAPAAFDTWGRLALAAIVIVVAFYPAGET